MRAAKDDERVRVRLPQSCQTDERERAIMGFPCLTTRGESTATSSSRMYLAILEGGREEVRGLGIGERLLSRPARVDRH